MTVDDLISEAQVLAKRCIYLVDDDPKLPFAAIWRGDGTAKPPADHVHWITIDCRFLPGQLFKQGCLSTYIDRRGGGTLVFDRDLTLSPSSSGTNLFATNGLSYPPIEAIFRFGSERIASWLETNKWQRDWEYNSNFPDPVANDYERYYQSKTPIFFQGPYAQLGGWHTPWPDGDWASLLSDNLVMWSFRDSEPWLEIWESKGVYKLIQRIT